MKFFLLALFVAAAVAAPTPLDDSQAVEVIVNGVEEGEALDISHIVDITLKEHANGVEAASSDLLHPYTAVGLAEAALAASAAIAPSDVILVNGPQPIAIEAPTPVVLPQPVVPVVAEPEGPSPISLPAPVVPSVPETPSPISLPTLVLPTVPEVPSPIVLPAPIVPTVPEIPSPIVLPAPVAPEVPALIPSPVIVQEPAVAGVPVLMPSPLIVEDVLAPAQEVIAPVPEPVAQLSNEVYNDGIVQVQLNNNSAGVMSTLQSWFNMVVNYFNGEAISSHQIV